MATITVPSHYAFVVGPSHEEIRDQEANYNITIAVNNDKGFFEVTGDEDDLESFVEDICISDADAVSDIMRTMR